MNAREFKTRASIGEWKCNFPRVYEIMTDQQQSRPFNQPTDGHERSLGSNTSNNAKIIYLNVSYAVLFISVTKIHFFNNFDSFFVISTQFLSM